MGPLIPLFWTSGDACPRFQSQGGSLACMLRRLQAMDSSPSALSATPAELLAPARQADPFNVERPNVILERRERSFNFEHKTEL